MCIRDSLGVADLDVLVRNGLSVVPDPVVDQMAAVSYTHLEDSYQ